MRRLPLAVAFLGVLLLPSAAFAEPVFGTCISCGFYTEFEEVALNYSTTLYDGIAQGAASLLNAAAFLWMVWEIAMYMLDKGTPFGDLIKRFFSVLFAGVIAQASTAWLHYIATPIFQTGIDWAVYIMGSTGADTGGKTGIEALMYAAETPAWNVFRPSLSFWPTAENIMRFFVFIILVIPWISYWVIIEGAVLLAILRFAIITAIGPFLMICAAFEPTRKIFWAGLKEIIIGSGDLVVSALYVGMVNAVMLRLFTNFPADENGVDPMKTAGYIFSEGFWTYVFAAITFTGFARYVKMIPARLFGSISVQVNTGNVYDYIKSKFGK